MKIRIAIIVVLCLMAIATLAIISDADNNGEKATAFVDYIEFAAQ